MDDRSEKTVEPGENRARHILDHQCVTELEDRVPVVLRRRSQQDEKGTLRRLEWRLVVVTAIRHERWYVDARRTVERIDFGRHRFPDRGSLKRAGLQARFRSRPRFRVTRTLGKSTSGISRRDRFDGSR